MNRNVKSLFLLLYFDMEQGEKIVGYIGIIIKKQANQMAYLLVCFVLVAL